MNKISPQDLASYVAVLVAAVALYVGWDQARIGRNQQHADVFPVIQITSNNLVIDTANGGTARRLLLKAVNAGVGPAFIENADWRIGDTDIQRVSDLGQLIPTELSALSEYQGRHERFLLAAGEEQVIWEIIWPTDNKSQTLTSEFLNQFWAMELSLCYCSLYERCWVSHYNPDTPRPKSVKSCPVNASQD